MEARAAEVLRRYRALRDTFVRKVVDVEVDAEARDRRRRSLHRATYFFSVLATAGITVSIWRAQEQNSHWAWKVAIGVFVLAAVIMTFAYLWLEPTPPAMADLVRATDEKLRAFEEAYDEWQSLQQAPEVDRWVRNFVDGYRASMARFRALVAQGAAPATEADFQQRLSEVMEPAAAALLMSPAMSNAGIPRLFSVFRTAQLTDAMAAGQCPAHVEAGGEFRWEGLEVRRDDIVLVRAHDFWAGEIGMANPESWIIRPGDFLHGEAVRKGRFQYAEDLTRIHNDVLNLAWYAQVRERELHARLQSGLSLPLFAEGLPRYGSWGTELDEDLLRDRSSDLRVIGVLGVFHTGPNLLREAWNEEAPSEAQRSLQRALQAVAELATLVILVSGASVMVPRYQPG